ncbi:unnamed protein product [Owenia fusiformis]|uniref:Uncharacterized protein n=1 Tax=Owenia fusiformis TaxID=6347 RepID=A0A8J1UDQ9_OWEFU|nr:unnamed protein product [Owenia fusiformis]
MNKWTIVGQILMMVVGLGNGKSLGEELYHYKQFMDPVDTCLLACYTCQNLSSDNLMTCANQLCLFNVAVGLSIPPMWVKKCPELHSVSLARKVSEMHNFEQDFEPSLNMIPQNEVPNEINIK